MERSPFQVMIELYFLKPSRSPQTFLVPGSRVAGRRLALRLRFGAFENDDIAWHGRAKGGKPSQSGAPVKRTADEPAVAAPNPTASELRNFRFGFSCSHWDGIPTVRRAIGIASRRAGGIFFPDILQIHKSPL